MSQLEEQPECETGRSSGKVKWFNNRAGYGFITVGDGEQVGEDIFVHHSALVVDQEQYKYLVQGEYVEFGWTSTDNPSQHKWQASDVQGINGGKLMCETRNESQSVKQTNKESTNTNVNSNKRQYNRLRGSGPRSSAKDEDGVEWLLVRKKKVGQDNQRSQHDHNGPKQHRH